MNQKLKNIADLVQDYFLFPLEGKEKYMLGLFDGFLAGSLARDLENGNSNTLFFHMGVYAWYHAAFGGLRYLQDYTSKHYTPSSKTNSPS